MTKRRVLKAVGILLSAVVFYLGLLCFPQPFFAYSLVRGNLTLYSDQPFPGDAGAQVLALAETKLSASPMYSPTEQHAIYICNADWRQRLFFNRVYGVGGVNFYPLTYNVFLRNALVEQNRLISPSGKLVAGERTLDYYVAHEVGHSLTGKAVGPIRYHLLSEWVREGYADYLGKGRTFNYDDALRAFLANAPEMDRQKSGLYLRYHLLVAYLLDKKQWSVEKLLEDAVPQTQVEAEVRANARP